jgi:metal-responsive CopG/Arc/MetJ family transcriptional regulator
MATLTVTDDRLRQIDEFAKEEALSRESVVDEAIDEYLSEKRLNKIRDEVMSMGITEEDIALEIKRYREEKRRQGE